MMIITGQGGGVGISNDYRFDTMTTNAHPNQNLLYHHHGHPTPPSPYHQPAYLGATSYMPSVFRPNSSSHQFLNPLNDHQVYSPIQGSSLQQEPRVHLLESHQLAQQHQRGALQQQQIRRDYHPQGSPESFYSSNRSSRPVTPEGTPGQNLFFSPANAFEGKGIPSPGATPVQLDHFSGGGGAMLHHPYDQFSPSPSSTPCTSIELTSCSSPSRQVPQPPPIYLPPSVLSQSFKRGKEESGFHPIDVPQQSSRLQRVHSQRDGFDRSSITTTAQNVVGNREDGSIQAGFLSEGAYVGTGMGYSHSLVYCDQDPTTIATRNSAITNVDGYDLTLGGGGNQDRITPPPPTQTNTNSTTSLA
ncbi:hypothetical protein IE53DRAFT_410372 [Violaceomyces palustris]|uniref:Uncharacterized protein n=1 Tax=Violaceomyces palustris TaxID=1673888 RepID=A0ACD0NZF1_9BASI|nr:hypothetical protein IE53DRAFT_410372 [Violaceomyces palustris]